MRRSSIVFVAILTLAFAQAASARDLRGAGSTFAFPIMKLWTQAYEKQDAVPIQYEPIGSSSGVTELKEGMVDFAVTDAPLVDAQLLRDGLSQFPLVIGGVAIAVNLDGIQPGQLHLTGEVLASIYLGGIKRWNDPTIVALNPDLALPNLPILPIYRSDGSGTTYNFTDFLGKVSPTARAAIGSGTSVRWPVGVGAKGTGGVAAAVTHVKGAVGYVEFGYAVQARLTYGLVRNQAGNYIAPSAASFRSAVASTNWLEQPNFYVSVTNAAPANAYPIVATSFVLVRTRLGDPDGAQALRGFFQWALEQGQAMAENANYLPLPATLIQQVEASWGGRQAETVARLH